MHAQQLGQCIKQVGGLVPGSAALTGVRGQRAECDINQIERVKRDIRLRLCSVRYFTA